MERGAYVLADTGDFAEALRLGNRAHDLAASPNESIQALRTLAFVYECGDLFEEAIPYLKEALRIDEYHSDVLSSLAHCYYMLGRDKDAIRTAKKCLMLDPDDEGANWILNELGQRNAT